MLKRLDGPRGSERGQIVWHYTILDRLQQIIADGYIRPATASVVPGEQPAVWFSSRQDWEPTAAKGLVNAEGVVRTATYEEMMSLGLARIGVVQETSPYNWMDFKRLSRCPAKAARLLYQAGIAVGARPSDWYVTFEAVPQSLWVAVQIFDVEDRRWMDLPQVGESWQLDAA